MAKMKLFLTDWAPNGTNDLLITTLDGVIKACIESATFGFSIKAVDVDGHFAYSDGETVMGGQVTDDDSTVILNNQTLTLVNEVTIDEVLSRICTSPVDPFGKCVLNGLKQYNLIKE